MPPDTVATGTFLPYRPASTAITYDPAVVPAGSTAQARGQRGPGDHDGTTERDRAGSAPGVRRAPAHQALHRRAGRGRPALPAPEGPGAAASPPSVDPAYANPANEVWLDFTADTTGAVAVTSKVAWMFDGRRIRRGR